ncbi:hypothetical protein CYLTODRAFT_180944 [Cylindrobasidium torrendii FP15055 ss-10]|uniref:Uncharacterized protein n=1 Tax=Cylindrobasidium torrendii FP15055 ss-10 TaxID=1314674 RepID=A0A0D7AVD3_9AGAR|nr:hypothetical protein CYLTODRAFT_180944 [Cylindrobasidium torrendii FP15055 ss-10]
MFNEEICWTCGKLLEDGGQECQDQDASSPCISSASSALSSPHLEYAVGGDVPSLVPSTLGSALRGYRHRHSGSSSASSTSSMWDSDDEDQDDSFVGTAASDVDTESIGLEPSSKPSTLPLCAKSRPLSYTRQPSGLNMRSTVPRPHQRGLSSSPPPLSFSDDDGPSQSESEAVSQDDDDCAEHMSPQSAPEQHFDTITKAKRARNRASLPNYFSLLQISTSAQPCDASKKGSPTVSTSSGQTIARHSPPTPRPLSGISTSIPPFLHRGRRLASHPGAPSPTSSSPSPTRRDLEDAISSMMLPPRPRLEKRGPTSPLLDKTFDANRGRATVRRNSSPIARMDDSGAFGHARETTAERRGRLRAEEMDGVRGPDAPGYGHGRSGLLHRERTTSRQR